MQIKVINYAIIYATDTVISSITITHKQNSFKLFKWKLKIQKEINGYRKEISILDKMNKSIKVKKIKRKYAIKSIDKIPIIKEKLK